MCYEPLLGFFFQKMIFFEEVVRASVSLLSTDCVSALPSLSSLVFIRVQFRFFLSLIVCVCAETVCHSIHFQTKISPLQLVLSKIFRRTLFDPFRRCFVFDELLRSGVSTGYPPVFRTWTECEIKGTKPKQVD